LANPKDWCHEEVACRFPEWLNEIGAAAGMRKESILFSYALIEAGGRALAPYWRVVSQRLERKGQVECWLCTPEGKKFARAQRSKAEKNSPLFTARRGDLWRDVSLGEKGDLLAAGAPAATGKTIFSFSG
jgi:hypothetical protein